VSAGPSAVFVAFLSAGLALVVALGALATALVLYQRRFLAMHRQYAEDLVRAHEEERARVARDVHDDALQRINILVHEVDECAEEPGLPGDARHHIIGLRGELEDLSKVLRDMAYRLHPSFHEQDGLVPLLEQLAEQVDRTSGVRVAVRHGGGLPRLTPECSLVAYRIAQEALHNVVRHAASPSAALEVSTRRDAVELTVADEGRGFDPAAPPHRGLGLISMSERARAVGGSLSVESRPNGGTLVRLVLPVLAGA
jgi:signal transduction histidine kinase